jgi:uncharacterized protein
MTPLFKSFAHASPGFKIIFSLGLAFIFMMIFLFISYFAAIVFLDIEPESIAQASKNPLKGNNLNVLRILQVGQTIGMFLVSAWVLAIIFGKNPGEYLKTNKRVMVSVVLLVFILVFLVQPFINLTAVLNRLFVLPSSLSEIQTWMMDSETSAETNTKAFLEVSSFWILLFNLIMIAVLPAIAEEFFFRGIIQRIFVDWAKNIHVGILLSAIVFSAFHMQFFTFVPRVIMGIYLGYLFVWSGSIWLPVFAHFVNNAVGVIGIYLIHNNYVTDALEPKELSSELLFMGIISAIITTGLLILVKKKAKNRTNNY